MQEKLEKYHSIKSLPVITEHVIFTYCQSTKFICTKVASEDILGTPSISATFPVPTSGSADLSVDLSADLSADLRLATAALKSWRIRPGSGSRSGPTPIYRRTIRTRGTTGSTRNLRILGLIRIYMYIQMTTPLLRQQMEWVGGIRTMAIFADVQYYFC